MGAFLPFNCHIGRGHIARGNATYVRVNRALTAPVAFGTPAVGKCDDDDDDERVYVKDRILRRIRRNHARNRPVARDPQQIFKAETSDKLEASPLESSCLLAVGDSW